MFLDTFVCLFSHMLSGRRWSKINSFLWAPDPNEEVITYHILKIIFKKISWKFSEVPLAKVCGKDCTS